MGRSARSHKLISELLRMRKRFAGLSVHTHCFEASSNSQDIYLHQTSAPSLRKPAFYFQKFFSLPAPKRLRFRALLENHPSSIIDLDGLAAKQWYLTRHWNGLSHQIR